jgi:hypothetical protein
MRRFTVMGFTEAELGFVVAALFAAIAVATLNDRDASEGVADGVTNQLEQTQKELKQVREDLERARAELADLSSRKDKRSTKVPQCWEKGEQREPIGEVVVIGASQYLLEGESVAVDGVLNHFSASIARSKERSCRFILVVRPNAGVDAVDHSRAVLPLRGYFDVSERPR